jgi:hypothetical protein
MEYNRLNGDIKTANFCAFTAGINLAAVVVFALNIPWS